jgi:FkbM family methyltransferase
MALIIADAIGPDGRVIAVEPVPHNVEVGRENCRRNGAGHVEVIHAAGGERPGVLLFDDLAGNGRPLSGGQTAQVEVPCLTVDDLDARYGAPALVLVDVEGFECSVLRGAPRVLAARPDWLLEVHADCGLELYDQGTVDQVLAFFPPEAYELFMATGFADGRTTHIVGKFEPLSRGSPTLRNRFFLAALGRR